MLSSLSLNLYHSYRSLRFTFCIFTCLHFTLFFNSSSICVSILLNFFPYLILNLFRFYFSFLQSPILPAFTLRFNLIPISNYIPQCIYFSLSLSHSHFLSPFALKILPSTKIYEYILSLFWLTFHFYCLSIAERLPYL